MESSRVTLKEIAERAGVSIGTVDRALNNRPGVSERSKRRVEQIAAELGYRPNRFASALSRRSEKRIAAVFPDRPAAFYGEIERGVDRAAAELRDFGVSVEKIRYPLNIPDGAARCLSEPDLVERVQRALRLHGVPGELLILELTEGSVVDDSVRSSTVLAELHALGLRLSMDDFGTGYSSLSQLRQLPIDEVKIDKSFVLGMSTSQGESFIARSIIELAHNLGLRVVAEGVEDELTRKLLTEMGCDKLQGFLVSRPLPDERLESWLLARTGVRSAAPGAQHRRLFVRA